MGPARRGAHDDAPRVRADAPGYRRRAPRRRPPAQRHLGSRSCTTPSCSTISASTGPCSSATRSAAWWRPSIAATYPAFAERLVLVSPIGLWRDDAPVGNPMMLDPVALVSAMFADVDGVPAKQMIAQMSSMLDQPEAAAQSWWVTACTGHFIWPLPDRGLGKRIHRINAPSLVIWGQQDGIIPPVYAEEFGSQLRRRPGRDHRPGRARPADRAARAGRSSWSASSSRPRDANDDGGGGHGRSDRDERRERGRQHPRERARRCVREVPRPRRADRRRHGVHVRRAGRERQAVRAGAARTGCREGRSRRDPPAQHRGVVLPRLGRGAGRCGARAGQQPAAPERDRDALPLGAAAGAAHGGRVHVERLPRPHRCAGARARRRRARARGARSGSRSSSRSSRWGRIGCRG